MLIQIFLFILLGVVFGTITGLTPGIHINLVGAVIVSASAGVLARINPIYLTVFITSMAIAHTFLDFIPSIFLGCPDTDTELSILPGHELLKEGRGHEAIMLANYGSLAAVIITVILAIPFGFFLKTFYESINNIIPFILIGVSTILILSDKNKGDAVLVFIITGILGYLILNLPEETLKQPLLPLLTGLFGTSSIILSIKNKPIIPAQKIIKPKTKLLRPLTGATIASPFCSLLPGLGSGQAAIIGQTISNSKRKEKNREDFLVLLGATNTLVMGFSFLSLYFINKTRTGAASAINEVMGQNFKIQLIILILIVTVLSGIIAFFLTETLSKFVSKRIQKINYSKVSYIILSLITIITFIVSGFWGLFILTISTFTGIYCIQTSTRRTNMMGCLLIPTILLYLL